MLTKAYLPHVIDGSSKNGNWEASMIEAAINIAVFTDDMTSFQKGVAMWKKRVPAYLYLSIDGSKPLAPPKPIDGGASIDEFWYSPTSYVDGLSQETCRDSTGDGGETTGGFGHAQYGVGALVNAAETALIQGVDLFSTEQPRFVAALEFHAKYENGISTSALCKNWKLNAVEFDPDWEIAYNEYAHVLGLSLPNTAALMNKKRPTGNNGHMGLWETLTHGDIGKAGL
jgi:hypothetical protein